MDAEDIISIILGVTFVSLLIGWAVFTATFTYKILALVANWLGF